jgi:crotonobetainyl-CoA:carnitine CoA-transferase CaiB-like acyl-CoA transferase
MLQERGISAGRVARPDDLLTDQALLDREFFVEHDHPEVGRRRLSGLPWRSDRGAPGLVEHAPLLGEHNWEVLVDWLGLSPERFAELVAEGVIA